MTTPSSPTRQSPFGVLLGIGTFANFFDALGIGSFATTTTALRLGRLVDDEKIPGTMNVGHATPTILEAVLFIVALGGLIDKPTIISMVVAGGVGAWYGAGIVANWPHTKSVVHHSFGNGGVGEHRFSEFAPRKALKRSPD